jgi:hypothetical protein
MEDCKLVITPMQTNCKLRKDDDSKSIDQRQYRSVIACLLYVTASRPDVMQAIGQVSEEDFQISQRNKRVWIMVSKRKGSINYCLHKCRLGRLN